MDQVILSHTVKWKSRIKVSLLHLRVVKVHELDKQASNEQTLQKNHESDLEIRQQ